jgi:hypothetical protein
MRTSLKTRFRARTKYTAVRMKRNTVICTTRRYETFVLHSDIKISHLEAPEYKDFIKTQFLNASRKTSPHFC